VAIPEAVSVPLAETLRRSVARRYRHFTSAEQGGAQAALRRPRLGIELPIQALAREIGVAPAVISRFSRTIGLSGFRALRVALAEELGAEGVAAAVVPQLDNHGAEPLWGAARASVLDDIAALQRNLDGIDPAAMAAAARLLAAARRVVTVGYATSGVVAKRLASMLAYRGWRTRAEVAPGDSTWASDIDPQDVVVAVSHRGRASGSGAELLMTLRQLRTQGTQVILLTNAPDGGLSQAATLVLATSQLGDDSEEAYVFDPVFPVQLLTMRALVAATIAARKMQ